MLQFIKTLKILYKFRKSFRRLRKNSETMSQKTAIENDPFLHELYMQKTVDFVKNHKLQTGTETYFSKSLYSTTFSTIHEMNVLSFLQYLLPLITPIHTFNFEKEKIYRSDDNSEKYISVMKNYGLKNINSSGVYPLPMISHSIDFPFSLMPDDSEKAIVKHFNKILKTRKKQTGKHPWLCDEGFGQAFLIWGFKK